MPPLWLLGLLAVSLIVIVAALPGLASALVLFIIYTNTAVVGYKFHGVPYALAGAISLLLLVPLAHYVIVQRRPLRWNPVLIPMLLLFCSQLVSFLFAARRDLAVQEILIYVVEGLILFFLVTNVLRDEADVRRGVWALLLAGALMTGLTLYQRATGTMDNIYGGFALPGGVFRSDITDGPEGRQAGPIGEENNYAAILLVLVPMGWHMFRYARSVEARVLGALMTALIIVGVVLTYSRAAGAILLVMMLALAYLSAIPIKRLAVMGGAIALTAMLIAPDYVGRLATLEQLTHVFQGDYRYVRDDALRGRASENLTAIEIFEDHPLIGVGEGNFGPLYQQYAREFSLDERAYRRPHNLYLGFAAEGGIFALLSLLGIFGVTLLSLLDARRLYRAHGHREAAALAEMLIVSILARMAVGMSLDLTYERYLWLLIALGAAVADMKRADFPTREYALRQPAPTLPALSLEDTRPVRLTLPKFARD